MNNNNYKSYVTNKQNDMNRETKVSDLLTNSFFKPYLHSSDPITDKDKQISGIDLESPVGNIDLKSAVTRLDGGLNTFCIELFFINSVGKSQKGWFLNSDSQTDYYSFNFFKNRALVENNNLNPRDYSYLNSVEDIGIAEIILVKKSKLKEFLKPYLEEKSNLDKMNEMFTKQISKHVIDNNVSISHSFKLREAPINLLVSKSKLIELADVHVLVDYTDNENTEILKHKFADNEILEEIIYN